MGGSLELGSLHSRWDLRAFALLRKRIKASLVFYASIFTYPY